MHAIVVPEASVEPYRVWFLRDIRSFTHTIEPKFGSQAQSRFLNQAIFTLSTFAPERRPDTSSSLFREALLHLRAARAEYDVEVDAEEVLEYLLRFPDMLEAVNQVIRTVREHLPEAQLELVVYHDPEIEDEYLVLYARFSQYTSAVMERIRAARRAYSPYIRDKSGWILLTTDFRQPRK
jgi:hypothetical protein